MRARAMVFTAVVVLCIQGRADELSPLGPVAVLEPFFNPSIGQKETIRIEVKRPGLVSVCILDRDGYLVRRLITEEPVQAETLWYTWDGRDEGRQVVPDEAYSLKIDLIGQGYAASYLPASKTSPPVKVEVKGYDRRMGVLSYKLSVPARVHAQAGVSRLDEKTKVRDGPVLRTIANREPRPGGPVVENWDGFDETEAYYLPDLPNFAVAVAATALPENAILSIGNDSHRFVESVSDRSGRSLLPAPAATSHNHQGPGNSRRRLATAPHRSGERLLVAVDKGLDRNGFESFRLDFAGGSVLEPIRPAACGARDLPRRSNRQDDPISRRRSKVHSAARGTLGRVSHPGRQLVQRLRASRGQLSQDSARLRAKRLGPHEEDAMRRLIRLTYLTLLALTMPVARLQATLTVSITSPVNLQLSNVYQSQGGSANVTVTGSVGGTTLHDWTLQYKPSASQTWTVINTGTAPITNGTLGTWQTLATANGSYNLQLRACDANHLCSTTTVNDTIAELLSLAVDAVGQPGVHGRSDRDLHVNLALLPDFLDT